MKQTPTTLQQSVIEHREALWVLVRPHDYLTGENVRRVIDMIGSGIYADAVIAWLQKQTAAPSVESINKFFREFDGLSPLKLAGVQS